MLPSTRAFATAVQEEKVETARAQALRTAPLPRVVSAETVYDDLRTQFFDEYFEKKKAKACSDQESVRDLRNKARLLFSKLSAKERISLCHRAAAKEGVTAERKQDLEAKAVLLGAALEAKEAPSKPKFLRGGGVVTTYMSSRVLLFAIPDEVESVEEAVEYCRKSRQVTEIFQRFCEHVEKVAQGVLRATQWSASAELCVETFLEKQVLRVHLHGGYHRSDGVWNFNTAAQAGLVFEGIVPHNNSKKIPGISFCGTPFSSKRKQNSRRDANYMAIHYYIQCESKVGSIFRAGSKQPFTGYGVKGSWITTWKQVYHQIG